MKNKPLRGDALLVATINKIIAEPNCHNQSVWHCGTTHCFFGLGQILAGFKQSDDGIVKQMAEAFGIVMSDAEWLSRRTRTKQELYGFVADRIAKGSFDLDGFDQDGFNQDGFNRSGFDQDGFNRNGFNQAGFDRDGFDQDGFDQAGFNQAGFDRNGFHRNGLDRYGFNRYGFDRNGRDRYGYDRNGFDQYGFDRDGKAIEMVLLEIPEE